MFSLRSQNLIKVLQEIMDIKQKTFVKDFSGQKLKVSVAFGITC